MFLLKVVAESVGRRILRQMAVSAASRVAAKVAEDTYVAARNKYKQRKEERD